MEIKFKNGSSIKTLDSQGVVRGKIVRYTCIDDEFEDFDENEVDFSKNENVTSETLDNQG